MASRGTSGPSSQRQRQRQSESAGYRGYRSSKSRSSGKRTIITIVAIVAVVALGALCIFGDVKTFFTGGLKAVESKDGTVSYYYYEFGGRTFKDGLKDVDGKIYYFQSDGQAFTDGYKVIEVDGANEYYYFQADGTAYTRGRLDVAFGSSTYYYHFGEDGRAAKDAFASSSGTRYRYGADGRAVSGWFEDSGNWYFAGDDGEVLSDTVIQGYKLSSDGTCPTKARVRTLVSGIVDDSMTDQEKISALFDWLVSNDMTYTNGHEHFSPSWTWYEGFVDDFAAELLDDNIGNCFRYASLMGLMLSEATELDVRVICGRTPSAPGVLYDRINHGWTEVYQDGDWYIYDSDMVKFVWGDAQRWRGYQRLHDTGYDQLPPYIITDLF